MRLKQLEVEKMIARAMSNGKFHGIELKHGRGNQAKGDCAFEAVIQNINDRNCFTTKFPLDINVYRNIWTTDMANRTVNSPWNTLGHQEWFKGWKEMSIPETYERGIFGDFMLPGIACGTKKIILISNTSLESPHDPIYVINPANFNVEADTEIPIVLAYNMAHYESMEPCSYTDVEATINLVRDYQAGKYKYSRKDLPLLLGMDSKEFNRDYNKTENESHYQIEENKSFQLIDSKQQNNQSQEKQNLKREMNTVINAKASSSKRSIISEIAVEVEEVENSINVLPSLCYRLKGSIDEQIFTEKDGKFESPICKLLVKNIQLHFNKNFCINKVDIEHFENCLTSTKKFGCKRSIRRKKTK